MTIQARILYDNWHEHFHVTGLRAIDCHEFIRLYLKKYYLTAFL